MDILGKTIWQQAGGDTNRNCADLCLERSVVLNGPGYAGPWPECQETLAKDGLSSRKLSDLYRFSEEMADGDLVILHLGASKVVAVGEVVGGYEWREEFGDIEGWDMQHVRRVRWLWQSKAEPAIFDPFTLKLGDTTQRIDSPVINDWIALLETPAVNNE